MISFKLSRMTQSSGALYHDTEGLFYVDPPQINAERLCIGLSINITNLRREQKQCQERAGKDRQKDRGRKRSMLSSRRDIGWEWGAEKEVTARALTNPHDSLLSNFQLLLSDSQCILRRPYTFILVKNAEKTCMIGLYCIAYVDDSSRGFKENCIQISKRMYTEWVAWSSAY